VDPPGSTEDDFADCSSGESLDWYDEMLIQTFPSSDALPLWD